MDNSRDVSRRITELDGIRGMAILLVLIWHYGACEIQAEPGTLLYYGIRALGLTWSGVDLFFVLSGFLIGGILLDNKDSINYFSTFYIRRICRIFPLYFFWVFLFIGAIPIAARSDWLFGKSLPLWSYLTFTQNIAMAKTGDFGPNWLGITWSLAIEEQFYLILPLMIFFLSSKRLPYVLACIVLAAPALRFILMRYPNGNFSPYVFMPCRADALMLGVLCAYGMRQEGFRRCLTDHRAFLHGLFALLLALAGVFTYKDYRVFSFVMLSYGYSVLALLYSCCLLIALTERRGFVTWVVRNPLMVRLGIIAYGVYLFHQGVSGLIHGLLLKQTPQIGGWVAAGVTLSALLITLTLAELSWLYFEKPLVVIGHSFKYRKRNDFSLDAVPVKSRSDEPTVEPSSLQAG